MRQLKLIFHPELRKGIGAWDFRGKGRQFTGSEKDGLWLTDVCPATQVYLSDTESIFSNSSLPGTDPLSKFFYAVKGKMKSFS